MDFPQPLTRGTLVSRYKRFFADVALDDGREITAHCPNPGAMLGLNTPGLAAWVSKSADPKRKLPHTLELLERQKQSTVSEEQALEVALEAQRSDRKRPRKPRRRTR